jgi:hypothetical protein
MPAITPSSAPALKRRAASPENSDSENVDPNFVDSIGKRKRAAFEDDVSTSKPSRYSLNTVPSKPQQPSTPRLDTFQTTTSYAPISAPPAAGRSPTKPKSILLPRKHRFAPPSFTKSPALSITAALNGTLAHKKTRRPRPATIQESKPKSWFFDIYTEPESVQDDRMNEWTISQSAISLDISDHESKSSEKADRGKENIDPNEVSAPVTRSMAAAKAASDELKSDIMERDRVALGDLNPADYYGAELDATSVVLVHDEPEDPQAEPQPEHEQTVVESSLPADHKFTFESSAPQPQDDLATADIGAVILAAQPRWETDTETLVSDKSNDELPLGDSGDIEIWESESAKDENEKQSLDLEVKLGEAGSELVLQEL